ncbi:fasciclin domain-containing protein [Mycolicibacterium tusciae]|uniref:fasciclin domain-containing protein n=1 Tax=Mycolicibacterium tusciae TaxID=75922 RepID=UPI00024A2DD0|nr:fasciclin domain-containing protein [Mycolicibacterium tusciae]
MYAKKTLGVGFAAIAAVGLSLGTATSAQAEMVGTGCSAYAQQVPTGPGSVQGMAMDPVAVAASNNPMLTTLTKAISGQLNPQVNLVDTLNGGQFTVFAPTDDAFAKIDPATIEKLKTDAPLLTSILTYHVVPGQAGPAQVVGTHATVQGADLTVAGMGNDLEVNDASVVCGGVQTANATVYLIDTVLMPPMN